jgi:hypothetical protein
VARPRALKKSRSRFLHFVFCVCGRPCVTRPAAAQKHKISGEQASGEQFSTVQQADLIRSGSALSERFGREPAIAAELARYQVPRLNQYSVSLRDRRANWESSA